MNFFPELLKLYEKTPKGALWHRMNENCPYVNFTFDCKNCYLTVNAHNNEECFYGRDVYYNKNCTDCDHIHHNELLYECLDCRGCYNGSFLQDCENCTDCDYCFDCRGCSNCFGSVGLRNKQYYFFNAPLKKTEYAEKVATIKRKSHRTIWSSFEELKQKIPHLFSRQVNTENAIGDYIKNSKNIADSISVQESEDITHCLEMNKSKDCCDVSFADGVELAYECMSAVQLKNANWCAICWEGSDLEYCFCVFRSNHCFGCVYLNHKEYHILNKPYSREEYFKKVAEIKDQLKKDSSYGRWFWPRTYPLEDTLAVLPHL